MCKRFGIFLSSQSITDLKANRMDARLINQREKIASTIEMGFPFVENRGKKDEQDWTLKYGQFR